MDCTIIPTVMNAEGLPVPSQLFTDILDYTKDREQAIKLYYALHTQTFGNWFRDSPYIDENGQPQLYILEDGTPVFMNHADEIKALANNGTWGRQNTEDTILNFLVERGIIKDKKFFGEYTLPRPQQGSDMLEGMYRYKDKPETTLSKNKIKAINEEIKLKYGIEDDLIDVFNYGMTYKVRINSTVLQQLNTMNEQNMFFSPAPAIPSANPFAKHDNLILQKRNLIDRLEDRLANLRMLQKKYDPDDPNPSQTIQDIIKTMRQIHDRLRGNPHEGTVGLYKEVQLVRNATGIIDMNELVNQDLQRMKDLSESENYLDLEEASEIADFYAGVETTNVNNNLLFTEAEIVNMTEDERKLVDSWVIQARAIKNKMDYTRKTRLIEQLNKNILIKRAYGSVDYDMVFGARKDAAFVDMLLMDMANGIWSDNGIIPQMLQVHLESMMNEARSKTKAYEARMNELSDRVVPIMEQLDGGKYRLRRFITKAKGVTWDLFFEKDAAGNATGSIIQRYSSIWHDAQQRMIEEVNNVLYKNRSLSVPLKMKAQEKARETRLTWYKKNAIMPDFTKMPEVMDFINDPMNGFDFLIPHLNVKNTTAPVLQGVQRQEVIKEQIKLLKQFKYNYEGYVQGVLEREGVNDINALSIEAQARIEDWFHTHNPAAVIDATILGAESYKQLFRGGRLRNVIPDTEFIAKVPRRRQVVQKKDKSYGYAAPTNYYNPDFDVIEQHPELYEMQQLATEVFKHAKEVLPAKVQKQLSENQIGLEKMAMADVLYNPDMQLLTRISKAFAILYERIRTATWIKVGSQISYEAYEIATGKTRKQINQGILAGKTRQIEQYFAVNKAEFIESYNDTHPGKPFPKLLKHTVVSENLLADDTIYLLADKLGVLGRMSPSRQLQEIKNVLNIENLVSDKGVVQSAAIPVGRILYNNATAQVVNQSTKNLPRLIMLYADFSSAYEARTEAMPFINTALKYYEEINDVVTQNTGLIKKLRGLDKKETDGLRTNAIKQVEGWYKRSAIGDFDLKHFWTGNKKRYTEQEKKDLMKIENAIAAIEQDKSVEAQKTLKELREQRESLGRVRAMSQGVMEILKFIRFKSLGYSLNSAVTNFLEGQIANEIAMAMGRYYPSEHWYEATRIVRQARTRTFVRGKRMRAMLSPEGAFVAHYMDAYTVLQDSRNEFQKAGMKTSFSLTEKLDPMLLNQSVEYLNQSPILVTAMMSETIDDGNGNTSSLWDAMDKKTFKLKPQWRTKENIDNWEKGKGEKFNMFKVTLSKTIVETHGDYAALRGNIAKDTLPGKALLMFKGWLPRAIYTRFGIEQMDIELGKKSKGRYRSHTATTAMLHGMALGAVAAGPVGAAVLGIGGFIWGKKAGIKSDVHVGMELVMSLFGTMRTMIGVPVNRITRKKVINIHSTAFLKKMGYDTKFDADGNAIISEQDIQNINANFVDLAMQLAWVGLTLVIKGALFDDEDEDDSTRRRIHNALVNRTWTMATQATMYVNVPQMWQDFGGNIAAIKFLKDVWKLLWDIQGVLTGNDIDTSQTGNRGRSKLAKDLGKMVLPKPLYDTQVMIQDITNDVPVSEAVGSYTFGFGGEFREPMMPQPYENMFKSEFKQIDSKIRAKRIQFQADMERTGKYTDEEIKDMKDEKYPTLLKQLKENRAVYGFDKERLKELQEEKRRRDQTKSERKKEKERKILEDRNSQTFDEVDTEGE
jgi:hypothetical protein